MDLWIVAAAAAAGYLAKYWQNSSRDGNGSEGLASGASNVEKPDSPSSPFSRFAWRMKRGEDVYTNRRKVSDATNSDIHQVDDALAAEVASTSGFDGEKSRSTGNYEDCNVLTPSSLPADLVFSTKETLTEKESRNGLNGDIGDNSGNPSTSKIDSLRGASRYRGFLRAKRSSKSFVRPLNSLESCLMAQLYSERAEMEEFVLRALPSPSTPTMRPLLVTDGRRIISRAKGDSFSAQSGTNDNIMHEENVFGVPPLPKGRPLDHPRKVNFKTEKGHSGRLSSYGQTSNGKQFWLQGGSHDGMVLFCLGISIGIISSLTSNRREVEKLRELLKTTENLVQDLQEELEMKDSLTVKELANEIDESQNTYGGSFQDRPANPYRSTKLKVEESSESMSNIEAELEAELERLGLNMNTSSLERRLSDHVELDPDFEVDFAQGELRADMVSELAAAHSESNQDASSNSTTPSGNYAVSPRELSLRLHEVIQSRLEERVMELETALENSQGKVQLMESEHKRSQRKVSNGGDLGYTFTQDSPPAEEECNSMAQPLVINLSGEALEAYNEAYEELMKINESEEEHTPENNQQAGLHSCDHNMSWGQSGGINGFLPHQASSLNIPSNVFYSSHLNTLREHNLSIQDVLDVCSSDDTDFDDEMEKQLIKQIVEKTKRGSPVVLNAQRLLFTNE